MQCRLILKNPSPVFFLLSPDLTRRPEKQLAKMQLVVLSEWGIPVNEQTLQVVGQNGVNVGQVGSSTQLKKAIGTIIRPMVHVLGSLILGMTAV